MIYLSGGGNSTTPIDSVFAEALDRSKPLIYIPNAIINISFEEALGWLQSIFFPLGIKAIEMWDHLSPNKDVRDVAGIYIGGGQTAHLLSQISESEFYSFLLEARDRELPIYGGSAGALILGKDIRSAPGALNLPERQAQGLNFYGGYSASCHYNTEQEARIKIAAKKMNNPVLCIPDETGVIYSGKLTILGKSNVQIISPGGEFEVLEN